MTDQLVTAWETTEQVMSRLHISRQTLYRYIDLGLPSHQPAGPNSPRLFDPIEVDEWIRSRCSDLTPAQQGRILCAHADRNGGGAHWLEPGEKCTADRRRESAA